MARKTINSLEAENAELEAKLAAALEGAPVGEDSGKLEALEAENAKLTEALEAKPVQGKSPADMHGPCCEKVVGLIVKNEQLGGRKHANYLKLIKLLK